MFQIIKWEINFRFVLYIVHLFFFYFLGFLTIHVNIFFIFLLLVSDYFENFGSSYVLFLVMVFNIFISSSWPYFKPKRSTKIDELQYFFFLFWFDAMQNTIS